MQLLSALDFQRRLVLRGNPFNVPPDSSTVAPSALVGEDQVVQLRVPDDVLKNQG